MKSVQMLQHRPPDRHRVILVVSQKWDRGSQASLRDVLLQAQFANVTITRSMSSTLAAEATSEPMPQPPPAVPSIARTRTTRCVINADDTTKTIISVTGSRSW